MLTVGEAYVLSCALTADVAEGCTEEYAVSTCYCGSDLCNYGIKCYAGDTAPTEPPLTEETCWISSSCEVQIKG